MNSLSLLVQQLLALDPHQGDLFVFRGKSGAQLKMIWHDGIGMSLYVKRLERGRFIWPPTVKGVVSISSAQLSYLLSGIDWRNPSYTHTYLPSSGAIAGCLSANKELAHDAHNAGRSVA